MQHRPRLAGGHRLDPARARADRALARGSRTGRSRRSSGRACRRRARARSRRSRRRARRRRTSRRRASSRRAPRASSIGVTNVRTGIASKTFSFTIRSTRSRSSGVSGCGCVKSKRSLSGRTAEPACLTWSPSTSRSAACSRCVAVWFAIVGKRAVQATTARTRSPAAKPAPSNDERLVVAELGTPRAAPRPRRSPRGSSTPASVTWPPPVGVERRLAQLREEVPVAELLDAPSCRQHVGLLVADELGRKPAPRAKSAARCRSLFSPPAREISRCSSISSRKPSTSTGWPRSSASSCVSSIGKP